MRPNVGVLLVQYLSSAVYSLRLCHCYGGFPQFISYIRRWGTPYQQHKPTKCHYYQVFNGLCAELSELTLHAVSRYVAFLQFCYRQQSLIFCYEL